MQALLKTKTALLTAMLFIIIGDSLAQTNVGIGTTTPTEKLQVMGNIKADTLKPNALLITKDATAGDVLTSDLSGNAKWLPAPVLVLPYARTQQTNGNLFYLNNTAASGGTAIYANATGSDISNIAVWGSSSSGRAGFFTSTSGFALETIGSLKFRGIGQENGAVLTSDASGIATWKRKEKLLFKATGFSTSSLILSGGLEKTMTDWASIPISINGNGITEAGFLNNATGEYIILSAGTYKITIKIHVWSGNGNGLHVLRIYQNTTNVSEQLLAQNSNVQCLQLSTIITLSPQDKISFKYANTSNASVSIYNNVVNNSDHEFTIEKID